jgi:hypothetical protein
MMVRAVVAWCAILLFAILNGALRQALLVPRIGEGAGHVVSTVLLSLFIVGAAWLMVPWIRPPTVRDAWAVGAVWLALTLAFEFLAGHFLFGDPWETLLADYNVARGRIWILVVITTLLVPVVVHAWRGDGSKR